MFQLHRPYSCISANVKLIANQNPRKFLNYVREQCKLEFLNLQIPLFLFDQMMSLLPRPSINDFNLLFAAMTKHKHLQPYSTVISLFRRLELSGTRSNSQSVGILANCYCHVGRVDFGFSLFAKSLKLGFPIESHIVLFNTLLNSLVENDQFPLAVKLLDEAVLKLGVQPNPVTYGIVVKGFCRVGDTARALHLLHQLNSHPMCCKPGVVMYSTLIDRLCKDKVWTGALKLFSFMQTEGISPDVVTYNSLILGSLNLGRIGEAKEMLVEMMDGNISPDIVTYNILVHMHCKEGLIDEARAIIRIMIKRGLSPNIFTYNILLNGYCLCGEMDKAREIVVLMVKFQCYPNVVTYSSMINGYVKLKRIKEAFDIFQEMFKHGIAPDVIPYTTLIDGLCKFDRLQMARQLFNDMRICGIKPDVWTYCVLLHALCKNAQLDEASALIAEMESNGVAPNIFIYNILIHSLCIDGQVKDAENLVYDLLSRGLVPDDFTFNTMIKGFRKKGLIYIAIGFLDKMRQIGCSFDKHIYNRLMRSVHYRQ